MEEPVVFHPYGAWARDEAASLGTIVPHDWEPPANLPVKVREEQWRMWLSQLVGLINQTIWPNWDAVARRWEQTLPPEAMEKLTRTDFAFFEYMAKKKSGRGLDTLPDSPVRSADCYSQRELFVIEDDRLLDGATEKVPFASYYKMYDETLPPATAAKVAPLLFRSIKMKLGNTTYQIKSALQRPRAYQTALQLGYPDFLYEPGQTACTPSACSGHCFQGLVGTGGAFEYFTATGVDLDDHSKAALQQYAVDIGDRRVMAGIHYASDNLSSWIGLMFMADRVFRNPDVKTWLWEAIANRSFVYRLLLEFAGKPEGDAYNPALKMLHSLAPSDGQLE